MSRPRRAGLVLLAAGALPLALPMAAADPRPLFTVESAELDEVSGIGVDADQRNVYLHEDAGKPAVLYVVDLTGRTRLRVDVPFENEDWEDLAMSEDDDGRRHLWIADTGDAFFVRRDDGRPPRTEFAVIRIREPVVTDEASDTRVAAEDATRFPLVYADRENHNAESLLVHPDSGRIYVVEKAEQAGTPAYLWQGPEVLVADGVNVLERIAQVPVLAASSAEFSPAGDRFVVRDGDSAYIWAVAGEDMLGALREPPVVVPLPASPQGEGVTFTPTGDALLTSSEGGSSVVWEVPLPADARSAPVEDEPGEALAEGPDEVPRDLTAVVVAVTATVVLVLGSLLVAVHRWRRARL